MSDLKQIIPKDPRSKEDMIDSKMYANTTPLKINTEPENAPLEKGEISTNHQFWGSMFVCVGVYVISGPLKTKQRVIDIAIQASN